MKKLILSIGFAIIGIVLFAQEKVDFTNSRPLNNFSLNLFGDASLLSANYERTFFIDPIFNISTKIGLGYNEEFQLCFWEPCAPPERYLTIPHHVTGNIGDGKHFFEFGLGGTLLKGNTTQPYLLYPIVGYRFLPLKSNKINFRIYVQYPTSGYDTDDIIISPIGLNVGYSF